MAELPDVRPGQVWADNDPRSEGRAVRVQRITKRHGPNGREYIALCVVIADRQGASRSSIGRTVAIRLDRFRPTRTGYRLLTSEAADG